MSYLIIVQSYEEERVHKQFTFPSRHNTGTGHSVVVLSLDAEHQVWKLNR